MSTFFTTLLNDHEFTFAKFGAINPMETFMEYATRELFSVFKALPELTQTYCLISGFPLGILNDDEIEALIRSAVIALDMTGIGAGLEQPSDSDVGGAFEMILDHIAMRIIETSRPAPSLTFSKDKLALANAHWTRQLSVLVSTLLFDAGQLREKEMRYTEKVVRIQATIDMAAYIRGLESSPQIDELFSALIELDAKYSIRSLNFTRHEGERLSRLRQVGVPTIDAVYHFALELLARRDSKEELIEDGQLWTREIYQRQTFEAVDREKHSNLWKPDNSDPRRYVKTDAPAKKRGRPVSAESKARKERDAKIKAMANKTDAFAAAWGDLFAKKAD